MENFKNKSVLLIQAIVFICICGLLLSGITWLFRSNDYLGRLNIAGFKNEEDLDVVFVGSSKVLDYYDPMIAWGECGFTSYSYSAVGLRALLSKEYLEDIRSTHEPKVYLVELSTFEENGSEINEGGLRNWSDSLPLWSGLRIKGLTHYLKAHDLQGVDIASYYLDIIRYHTNTEQLGNSSNWSFLSPHKITGSHKGFEPLLQHVAYIPAVPDDERMDSSEVRTEDINDILDYCDKYDLNVVFTISPDYHKLWSKGNSLGDIIEARGYTFMDLNRYYDEMGFDLETDLANSGHANYLGAVKCTSYMAAYLKQKYDLPDHRTEEGYDKWRSDYEEYKEAVAPSWKSTVEELIASDRYYKELGDGISLIDDPEDWISAVQSTDFDIIICSSDIPVNDDPKGTALEAIISECGDDFSEGDSFAGIIEDGTVLYSSRDGEDYTGEIGRPADRVSCHISTDGAEQISIGEEDITWQESAPGIAVVVYNPCYHVIVDNVYMMYDEQGKTVISRQ